MAAKKWTEAENEFIKNNYQTMSNKKLAEKFKVTPKAIEGKLRKLNLKRKKDILVSQKSDESKIAKKGEVDRSTLHCNIRCRICLIVDGYTEKEDCCRFCGAKLFKQDVL
ncbi:hypothetical protein LR013_02235 [candidate division NPL-UPA2 bacterium]|nr:hypothetical protein [candidate division NPL-UPA2 bacterium]